MLKALARASFLMSAVSTCFAIVLARVLGVSPVSSLVFAAWSATLGVACLHGPKLWLAGVEYVVTEQHVIYKRGPFRRTIERGSISFARIFWSKDNPGVGDLELVRAVPTGALRRRLMRRLVGLAVPDRVWAIVRGVATTAPSGVGERPLTQRLDEGERVLWSARPKPTLRAYVALGSRELAMLALSFALTAALTRMLWHAVPNLQQLVKAGLPATSLSFAALVLGEALAAGLVATLAGYFAYDAVIRHALLVSRTRYLVTDRRVLIQRGREELHLDRGRIVDVIDAPAAGGLTDVFLVLDGPRARALAASGAFGEAARGPHLVPVLESVEDAESVGRILRAPSLPHAA